MLNVKNFSLSIVGKEAGDSGHAHTCQPTHQSIITL